MCTQTVSQIPENYSNSGYYEGTILSVVGVKQQAAMYEY